MFKKFFISSLMLFAFVFNTYSMELPEGDNKDDKNSSITPEELRQLNEQATVVVGQQIRRNSDRNSDGVLSHEQRVQLGLRRNGEAVEERMCSVCLQPLIDEKEDVEVMILPCSHVMHKKCGQGCLNRKRNCPCCRGVVAPGSERSFLIKPGLQEVKDSAVDALNRAEVARKQQALENIDKIVILIINRYVQKIAQKNPGSKRSGRRRILISKLDTIVSMLMRCGLTGEPLDRALNKIIEVSEQTKIEITRLEAQGQ